MSSSAAAPFYLLTLSADDINTASWTDLRTWMCQIVEFFSAHWRNASERENVLKAAEMQKLIAGQLRRIDLGDSCSSSFRRAHSRTDSSSHLQPVTFKLTAGESTVTANNDETPDRRSKHLRTPPEKFESAASNYGVTSNDPRPFSMKHGCSIPSDVIIGGQSTRTGGTEKIGRPFSVSVTDTSVHRRKAPDSEILDQQMNDLQGRSRYWNTTREPLQALAQQTSFPVCQGADLSSGAQNVADEAICRLSLLKTSFQVRRSTVTDSVSTSPPPDRDKSLAKSTKPSQMKSGEIRTLNLDLLQLLSHLLELNIDASVIQFTTKAPR